ncbi:MAG TPA: dienelactone hydrolase family protein [Gaiellaceae bacterium]
MCFDDDSAPPVPVVSGAAISHDRPTLTAADGNEFAAFRALPEEGGSTGVVILPDVRGLYRFYEELALRFAERGYAAIAFDYFGRTAGVGERDDDFEYRPHVDQTTPETVQQDVRACVEALRAHGCTSIFTVGFCFGGSGSWAAAAAGHGLKGAAGFYGRPERMLDRVPDIDAPLLVLQAGGDANITHEHNLELERALREHGKEYELIEYEGAPHSFFDRKQEEFADASADAWRRVLEFIARYE